MSELRKIRGGGGGLAGREDKVRELFTFHLHRPVNIGLKHPISLRIVTLALVRRGWVGDTESMLGALLALLGVIVLSKHVWTSLG